MKTYRKILHLCALSAVASACAEVAPPKTCEYNTDCEKGEYCSEQICVPDPCFDGVLSPNETDIDCGNICSNKCDPGQKCHADSDCKHNACVQGICTNPEQGCASAEPGDLLIAEILNNVSAGKKFEAYGVDSTQTEFVEIYNPSNKKIALSPISVKCKRTDDGSNKEVSFSMNGCIEPHNAAVISNTPITNMPSGVLNIQSITESGVLTNTANYTCELVQKSTDGNGKTHFTTLHAVSIDAQAKAGVSETLEPLTYSSSTRPLMLHTDASLSVKFPLGTKHSPGYCANGAQYRNQCNTLCDNGKLDEGETDIDCGGMLCDACATDKRCLKDEDCISNACVNGKCAFRACTIAGCPAGMTCDAESGECHSCSDGIRNGDETDIDCGGMLCGRCKENKSCKSDDDCESFSCKDNLCTGQKIDCQTPEKGDIVITEILNNASTSSNMATFIDDVDQKQIEFVEIVNLSEKHLALDGLSVQFKRLNGDGSQKLELRSCLAPNQAAVVSGTPIAGLPENVANIVVEPFATQNLNNKAIYEISLRRGEDVLHLMHDPDTPSAGVSHVIDSLDFSDEDITLVKHTDLNASLKHSPGYCTNGALFSEKCILSCENEALDDGETDIDCGGSCPKCAVGKKCLTNDDCSTNSCKNNICAEIGCTDNAQCPNGWCNTADAVCESCSDNAKNGDETDVDCGGSTCASCDAGKKCLSNDDCLSFECRNTVCVGTPVKSFGIGELVINEVMGSPSTSKFFSIQSETNQCEFVEIVSIATERRNLNGWKLMFQKSGSTGTPTEIPLSGILEPKHGIVIHNCASLPLPKDMREQRANISNIFTNTSDYDIWLANGDENTDVVHRRGLSANGKSQTRQADLDPASALVFHDTVSTKNNNSPGYCANGGLFSENCITTCENNQKDPGETDIDCGGPDCEPCQNNKVCNDSADCASGYCNAQKRCDKAPCTKDDECADNWTCDTGSGKCISCSDGAKNGSETDIDCGGSCGACADNKMCLVNADCISGLCSGNRCAHTTATAADPDKLIVNEIFDSSAGSPAFPLNLNVKACEFIEIANPTANDMNLNGLQLILTGTNASNVVQTPVKIDLNGILKSKNLLVVNNCSELPLPKDATSFHVDNAKLITGTWTYKVELVTANNSNVQIDALPIASVTNASYNRDPDMTLGVAMKKTTDAADAAAFATPGYCRNGGLYSDNCKVQCENGRKDGDETDVDCGGPTCGACANNKLCRQPSDCLSGQCNGGRCAGDVPVAALLSDLVINEVMGSPKTSDFFAIQTGTNQCEFVEIVNRTSKLLDVSNITLNFAKGDAMKDTPDKKIALTGTIPKNGVLVVSEKAIPMPSDGVNIIQNPAMTNGSAYVVWLSKGSETSGLVKRMALSTGNGKSQNRSVDLGGAESLIWHPDVATTEKLNSPGYCANGNKFSAGCN